MSVQHPRETSSPGVNFSDADKFGRKQVDALVAMQRELYGLAEAANRNWLARVELERTLASELAAGLSSAKSPSDAAKAYQDWMNRRMHALADDGRKLFDDSQKFMAAATKFLSGGGQKPG